MTPEKKYDPIKIPTILLIAGTLFLANPVFTLTDILPDGIGWLLIWVGLREFSSFNDRMFLARRYAIYLALVGFLKPVGQYLLHGAVYQSDSMMAAMLFCGGEIALMCLFFGAFITGCEEISRAGDCNKMYLSTGDTRFFCILFTWVRGLCTFLPELVAIPAWLVKYGTDSLTDRSDRFLQFLADVASSKELFIVICSTLEVIVAVVWLVRFLPFLSLYVKDGDLNAYLRSFFEDDNGAPKKRSRLGSLRLAKYFVWLSVVFLLDFRADTVRLLPVWGFPLCLAFACFFMDHFSEDKGMRCSMEWMFSAAIALFLAELFRKYCTVWDMRAIEEQDLLTELLSAAVILVSFAVLLKAWLTFATGTEQFASRFAKGTTDFDGIPYLLLVLYGALQTLSFTLPLWNGFLTLPRIALTVGMWLTAARWFSAMEEETRTKLSLYGL